MNGKVIIPKEAKTASAKPLTKMASVKRKAKEPLENSSIKRHKQNEEVFSREYVVEYILAHKVKGGRDCFLIKWKGYSESYNSWEPMDHLSHCPKLLDEFCTNFLTQNILDILCSYLNVAIDFPDKCLESLIPSSGFSALTSKLNIQKQLLKLYALPPTEKHTTKIKRGKEALFLYFLLQKRDVQLNKLTVWEQKINDIEKSQEGKQLVTVENDVDLEGPPQGFVYINESIPLAGVEIPTEPPLGCSCEECIPKAKSCCGGSEYRYTYNKIGRINLPRGTPIYECNKLCKCDARCRNRIVQLGQKVPLCIFRTRSGCGWGVKASRKIFAGEFVCEYVGEIVTHEEAERRGEVYDAEGRTYLFDLDFNSSDNPYTIDAAKYGNVSHFINHSCNPNLAVWAVFINCLDPNLPRLALFSIREISKGEELTFDYMADNTQTATLSNPNTPVKVPPEQDSEVVKTSPTRSRLELSCENQKKNRPLCKCSADSCRRYLF